MTSDISSILLLALGIILALVKLFDYFSKNKSNKEVLEKIESLSQKINCHDDLTKKVHELCAELSKMNNVRDEDGTPLIYVPRSLGRDQKRIAEIIQGMVFTLESMLRELQKQ